MLSRTLDQATTSYLLNNKGPSRKTGERDTDAGIEAWSAGASGVTVWIINKMAAIAAIAAMAVVIVHCQ